MEQYTDNQYDDDLTDSSAEYDDSYYTGAEDLFDYTPDEESPISRLKNLVLSIDWEITDDVLTEFNEELIDLKDIWAGEKINLVYVQALEKLSRYIYQKKAESHPSAIKLLLTLYHNLEKIVTSDDLSEAEKKAILLEDVKRFENLKSHLKTSGDQVASPAPPVPKPVVEEITQPAEVDGESELINLKAIVLGIDWEITDDDLSALRKEVVRLENLFAGSRPKLIMLQGIGTIGAYIKVKKSDAHADAFKVLHLFYDSLEKIVDTPMSVEEEKAILFPAVEKFNEFKALLGETIAPDKINQSEENLDAETDGSQEGIITPAFSDIPEDEVKGFQADEEAAALGIENPDNVNDHVANFFGEDSFVDEREPSQELPGNLEQQLEDKVDSDFEKVDPSLALQGVDVEEGDEEEDEGVAAVPPPVETEVTPALSPDEEEPAPALFDGEQEVAAVQDPVEEEEPVKVTFPDEDDGEPVADFSSIDRNLALQGVDVESEADDDSDEDALPVVEGELAPALADNDETSIYTDENLEKSFDADGLEEEIADTVLDFFEDESAVEAPAVVAQDEPDSTSLSLSEDLKSEEETEISSALVDSDVDDTKEVASELQEADEVDAVAASDKVEEVNLDADQEDIATDIEGRLDDFFGSDDFAADAPAEEMFSSMGIAEQTDPTDPSQPAAVTEETQEDEEEVIFELVEEDFEDESTTEPESVPEVAGLSPVVGELDETESSNNEIATSLTDTTAPATTAVFAELENCIEATEAELEDNILSGLLAEIDTIEQELDGQAYEKTYTHLLRIIATHVDRYRYEAGSQAFGLLKSVSDAFKNSRLDPEKREELLYQQTVNVLDWQQEIIASDTNKNADRTQVKEPLFVQELGKDDEVLTFDDDLNFDDEQEGSTGDGSSLKDEISSLRKSLQDEISELKKNQGEE